jgi:hypothetical protein
MICLLAHAQNLLLRAMTDLEPHPLHETKEEDSEIASVHSDISLTVYRLPAAANSKLHYI